jgi:DnaJ family protein C protein 28
VWLERPVKVRRSTGRENWESWIDQQIREAEERGDFDDLPGKGRPLELTSNPSAQDLELAFKILKDSGYAPDWIELDKAIRSKLERARVVLARHWERRNARLDELAGRPGRWTQAERARVEGSWAIALAEFEQEVMAVNKEISELNLKMPGLRFQRMMVSAEIEIQRLTGDRDE